MKKFVLMLTAVSAGTLSLLADNVIAKMRHLTGHVPMVPLWTYGFHQSRERYKSQNELFEVVDKYRELGIPFDGVIQDWQYWGSNYNYLDGKFSNIRMSWNYKEQTLTIDSRRGSFDGMPLQRTFKVVLPDGRTKELAYSGRRVTVKM